MRTLTRTIPVSLPNRSHIVIQAELRIGDPRGLSDGFSITGSAYEPRSNASGATRCRRGSEADSGGAIHDEILRAAPGLAPLIRVHLAAPDGTPMHAVANGWYLYSGDARHYEERRSLGYENREGLSDRERAARALHISADALPEGMNRDAFVAFCESLRPQWQRMADDAVGLMESIPTLYELRGYGADGQAVTRREMPAGIIANGAKIDV